MKMEENESNPIDQIPNFSLAGLCSLSSIANALPLPQVAIKNYYKALKVPITLTLAGGLCEDQRP